MPRSLLFTTTFSGGGGAENNFGSTWSICPLAPPPGAATVNLTFINLSINPLKTDDFLCPTYVEHLSLENRTLMEW